MDYLITNGYPAAANKFAVEANIQLRTDLESIQERVEIRTAIYSGDIQSAVEKINELNPQVRKSFPLVDSTFPSPYSCYDYTKFHAPLLNPLRGFAEKQTSSVLSMSKLPKLDLISTSHSSCKVPLLTRLQ